jgi:hypothetical protein
LIRVLLKIVVRADFEDEVAQVLGRHLDGDVNPLSGGVLPSHDAGVAPDATYRVCHGLRLRKYIVFIFESVLTTFESIVF